MYQLWDPHGEWKGVNLKKPVATALLKLQQKSKQQNLEGIRIQHSESESLLKSKPGSLPHLAERTARRQ